MVDIPDAVWSIRGHCARLVDRRNLPAAPIRKGYSNTHQAASNILRRSEHMPGIYELAQSYGVVRIRLHRSKLERRIKRYK